MKPSRIMLFDVFGTVLDWETSIAHECCRLVSNDYGRGRWQSLAHEWMKGYSRKISSLTKWRNLDELLVEVFYEIHEKYGLGGLEKEKLEKLSSVWERLKPWPDAYEGFCRLGYQFDLGALSNANLDMLITIEDSSRLPWDYLFSAESAKCYKPCEKVYTRALKNLNASPEEVIMVAAHTFDLNAAHKLGMRTALISREGEPGSDKKGLDHIADFIVPDLIALADIFSEDCYEAA